jgi:hypothetical protein
MYMRVLAPWDSHWRLNFLWLQIQFTAALVGLTYLFASVYSGNEILCSSPIPRRSAFLITSSALPRRFPTGPFSPPFFSQIGTSSFLFSFSFSFSPPRVVIRLSHPYSIPFSG